MESLQTRLDSGSSISQLIMKDKATKDVDKRRDTKSEQSIMEKLILKSGFEQRECAPPLTKSKYKRMKERKVSIHFEEEGTNETPHL